MTDNVKITPKFHGLNFPIRKLKDDRLSSIIRKSCCEGHHKAFVHPDGDEDTWFKIMVKEFEVNTKSHFALLQALNDDDISRVINCTSSCDIWQCLIITHEGTTQVRKQKLICSIHNMIVFICLIVNPLIICLHGFHYYSWTCFSR